MLNKPDSVQREGNTGTTNYRSSPKRPLNKSLCLTGILQRGSRAVPGWQVESRRAYPKMGYFLKGFGFKPINGKN